MTEPTRAVVDVDDVATWPSDLAVWGSDVAHEFRGTDDYFGDLPVGQDEGELRSILAGCLLRGYHCTRLLDYEAEDIRANGLRALDGELVVGRINRAAERNYLTEDECRTLQQTHHFARELPGSRASQVCLVLSATTFDHHAHGFWRLLSTWGGEAIYWAHADRKTPLQHKLQLLGRPTIVQALIDLDRPGKHNIYPSLANIFVGAALGLPDISGEVFYRTSIPAGHIEQIVQPGDPGYDRHVGLPRN